MTNLRQTKKGCRLFCCFCLLLFFVAFSSGDSLTDPAVSDAAQRGLNRYLDRIPAGFEKHFGFESRKDFLRTVLGAPYRLYTTSPDLFRRHTALEAPVISMEIWRFPVICDGRMRTLLTVANTEGIWRAVDIGGTGIASELDSLESIYVIEDNSKQKAILRLYGLKADFLILYETGRRIDEGVFIPLQSARSALGLGRMELVVYTLQELLPLLEERIGSGL